MSWETRIARAEEETATPAAAIAAVVIEVASGTGAVVSAAASRVLADPKPLRDLPERPVLEVAEEQRLPVLFWEFEEGIVEDLEGE
jgi:hypothetical protein